MDPEYSKYLNDYDDGEEILPRHEEDASAEDAAPSEKKKANDIGKKKKRNKVILIVLICILSAIILGVGIMIAYLFHVTKGADYENSGIDYNDDAQIVEDENLNFAAMGDVTDASSLNDYLYNWANNGGEKMHSKNVINVLLCGIDSTDGTASDGRADSIILVSVNKKAKTITLTSLFRDSYIYMDIPQPDGSKKGRYEKINAAYIFGGPAALIDTVEKNFKVEIDEYIAVDFASFKKLIDSLGGVTVDVEPREATYIRRTSSQKDFPSGKGVKLNGKQALIYSRIRHLDSDIARTERQRKVIKALISSAQTATYGQLVNAYKNCAKYIRTGYSQTEVISLMTAAASQKWMSYKMTELTLPSEENVETISSYLYTTSSPNVKAWVWIVDYPVCAQKLQLAVYGETNIVLAADRVSVLDYTNAKRTTAYDNDNDDDDDNNSGGSYYNTTRGYRYNDDDDDDDDNNGYSRSYSYSSTAEEPDDNEPVTQDAEPTQGAEEPPTEAPEPTQQEEEPGIDVGSIISRISPFN